MFMGMEHPIGASLVKTLSLTHKN